MTTTTTTSNERRLGRKTSKPAKRQGGRTSAARTPLHVRSLQGPLDPKERDWVEERLGRELGKFATHIERVSVRFEDINGPRGGAGIECRAKVVLSGLPSVLADGRGRTQRTAFNHVAQAIGQGVRSTLGRKSRKLASRSARGVDADARSRSRAASSGAGDEVDTALPGVSASDKKVGRGSSGTRNVKARRNGMTSTLEDSATGQPSRKSTRKGANRAKSATGLERRARQKTAQSKTRAQAARA